MKIGCFCMVRNEGMIIPAFLDQVNAFFDVTFFLDHSSSDETPKLIRDTIISQNENQGKKIKLFHLIGEGQPQMEVSNFFARRLFKEHDVDYVFLLDGDEFLPFCNREELERFLTQFNGKKDVIYYKWRNLCPEFLDGAKDIFKHRFYLSQKSEKQSLKVVLTKNLLQDDDWQVVQGNHYVIHAQEREISYGIDKSVELYHIPIQSYKKFMFKIMSGSLRLRMEKKLLAKGLGCHWDILNTQISRMGVNHDEIFSYALGYPEKGSLDKKKFVDFNFPYVKTPVKETPEIVMFLLQGMMNQVSHIGCDTEQITLLEEEYADYAHLPKDFDGKKYLEMNRDVLDSPFNPEFHYMKYGFREGRRYK